MADEIDQTAKEINIKMDQGSTFLQELVFTNDDTTPLDITAFTFAGQARKRIVIGSIPDFFFTFTQTAINKLMWKIPVIQTSVLTITQETDYAYDVEMTAPDLTVKKIAKGIITLYPEETR